MPVGIFSSGDSCHDSSRQTRKTTSAWRETDQVSQVAQWVEQELDDEPVETGG